MYNDKRDIVTSPRIVELTQKRKKRRFVIFILFIIIFVGVIIGLAYLSNYKKITIENIQVSGTHIIDSVDIDKKVQENLSGRYISLFAKKNSFIYPKASIEKSLKKSFPRIENLSIKLHGLNTLQIVIEERNGAYLYCGEKIPENNVDVGENCYFVNSDGYIFDNAPYFSGHIYFKFYTKLQDANVPMGQNVLPQDKFRQIISFIDGLSVLGLNPISVVMNGEDYAFHLSPRSDGGEPEILFKSENDLPTIFNNLSSAMKKKEFKDEIIGKMGSLLYIDLRFDNKVLYKFSAKGGSASGGKSDE